MDASKDTKEWFRGWMGRNGGKILYQLTKGILNEKKSLDLCKDCS